MWWLLAYVAAMFCIALPVAWFGKNQVAAAVFVVWAVGQVAYVLGFPEPETQVGIYLAAFAILWVRIAPRAHEVSIACVAATTIFLPLALVSFLWASGGTPEIQAWWAVYWLAMLQVAMLVRPIAWFRGVRGWLASRAQDRPSGFRMVMA